jgi:hypothetical protein
MKQKLICLFIQCTVFIMATETVTSAPPAVSDNKKSEIRTQKNLVDSVYTYRLMNEESAIVRKNYYTYHDNGQISFKKMVYPYGTYVLDIEGLQYNERDPTEYECTYDIQGNLVSRIKKRWFADMFWLEDEVELYYYNGKKLPDSVIIKRVCGYSDFSEDGFSDIDYCIEKQHITRIIS